MLQVLLGALLGAALASLPAHGVLPDKPKPKPSASAPAPAASTPPAPVDPMKAILERFEIAGEWTVEAQRRDKSVFRGTLAVSGKRAAGSYYGTLTLSSHVTGFTVRQDAEVEVDGELVRIRCSNAELLRGTGPYNADQFELSIVEPKVLRGTGRNNRGAEGTVLMIKK